MARIPRSSARPNRGSSGGGFLGSLGSKLKVAGAKTRQYGKLGIAKGELEKEKLALSNAYSKLGEAVFQAWSQHPDEATRAQDPAFNEVLQRIDQLRQKIKDVTARMGEIRNNG